MLQVLYLNVSKVYQSVTHVAMRPACYNCRRGREGLGAGAGVGPDVQARALLFYIFSRKKYRTWLTHGLLALDAPHGRNFPRAVLNRAALFPSLSRSFSPTTLAQGRYLGSTLRSSLLLILMAGK